MATEKCCFGDLPCFWPDVPTGQVLRPAQPRKNEGKPSKSKGKGKGKNNTQPSSRDGRGRGQGTVPWEPWDPNQGTAPNRWYRRSNNRDYDPQYSWRGGWAPRQPTDQTRGHQRRGGRGDRGGYSQAQRDHDEYERYCADRDRERAASRARRDNPY